MRLGPFIGRLLVVVTILAALFVLGWSLSHIETVIRVAPPLPVTLSAA